MDVEYAEKYRNWVAGSQARNFGPFRCRSMLHFWTILHIGDGPITYVEFGVRAGRSFRWWVDGNTHPESRFVGFDSFEGLPEPWQGSARMYARGDLTMRGQIPNIKDPRAEFVKGWFDDTVPSYDFTWHGVRIVHVDCDLYSSSRIVFDHVNLRSGDYLIMDDAGVGDEMKAFLESGLNAEPIAHAGSAVVARVC